MLAELARGTSLFVPILLGITTGMRRGEMVALRSRNVDLDNARLLVVENAEPIKGGVRYKHPKSGKGRTLALSALVVEEMRAHRRRQVEDLLKLGARLGADTFVIAQPDGNPYHPNSLSEVFHRFVVDHRLPRFATGDGDVEGWRSSEDRSRLGHASINITLDLYSHVVEGMQEKATERVDETLRIALQKYRPKPVG